MSEPANDVAPVWEHLKDLATDVSTLKFQVSSVKNDARHNAMLLSTAGEYMVMIGFFTLVGGITGLALTFVYDCLLIPSLIGVYIAIAHLVYGVWLSRSADDPRDADDYGHFKQS